MLWMCKAGIRILPRLSWQGGIYPESDLTEVLIVFNPQSGSGRKALIGQVSDYLRAGGCSVSVYETQCAGDAIRYLQSLEAPLDVVAVAGGDGTVNEVLNGLARRENGSYRLAVIPAGTTNVLAMELGLRDSARQIADVIINGKEQAVFPAQLNDRRYLLMAGIGYDAWVVDRVDLALKKKVGKLAYVLSMLKQLRHFGSRTYRVMADGREYRANSVVISNSRYYGGAFVLSRHAGLSRADTRLVMISGGNPFKFLFILLGLPLGIIEKMPGITSLAATEIRIESLEEDAGREPVQADGDSLAELPVHIRMDSLPLRILVP